MSLERNDSPNGQYRIVDSETFKKGKKLSTRLEKLNETFLKAEQRGNELAEKLDFNVTRIAYTGDPFVFDSLNSQRELELSLPDAEEFYRRGFFDENPAELTTTIYGWKNHGLSLIDIENMNSTADGKLDPNDIRRLNIFFRTSILSKWVKTEPHLMQLRSLIYLATVPLVKPEQPIPKGLLKLRGTITKYLDYYVDFFTDFNRNPMNEAIMMLMLGRGKPWLPNALATYLPARLGITPNSAITLYDQRTEFSNGTYMSWRTLRKHIVPVLSHAYSSDSSSMTDTVVQYNRIVQDKLVEFLQPTLHAVSTVSEQLEIRRVTGSLEQDWHKYKKDVAAAMGRNKTKQLVFEYSKSHPFDRASLTKHRDTFQFSILCKNQEYLFLELNSRGQLFGVPAKLLRQYPFAHGYILREISRAFLEPHKPQESIVVYPRQVYVPRKEEIPQTIEAPKTEATLPKIEKPQKRKRLYRPQAFLNQNPEPPASPELVTRTNLVAYTEDQIKEKLGPRVSRQQKIVDQILNDIRNFELGYGDVVPVEMLRDPVIRLKSGKFRILLNNNGDRTYSLRDVTRRDQTYTSRRK